MGKGGAAGTVLNVDPRDPWRDRVGRNGEMTRTRDAEDSARRPQRAREVRRKLKPGPAQSPEEVAASQRARLRAALIDLVEEGGYDAVTVKELARRANISTRDFYKRFRGKDGCLLDTYEDIMLRAARHAAAATKGESDWPERLRRGIAAFARELANDPPAARLAMVEVYAVGRAALERTGSVSARFESMLGDGLAAAPGGGATPSLLLKAIATGLAHVARAHVLAGRENELPDLVDELLKWILAVRSEAIAGLALPDGTAAGFRPVTELSLDGDLGDARRAILATVARLAGRDGYVQLSEPAIRAAALVPRRSFKVHFDGIEASFFAALELLNRSVIEVAERESAPAPDWPSGIHRALAALCAHAARQPTLAQLGFIEVFAPGAEGARQRTRLLEAVAERFRATAPSAQRPGAPAAQASIGAVWGVVHFVVAGGRTDRLPRLAPLLSYLCLAPAIGPRSAVRAINAEQRRLDEEASSVARRPAKKNRRRGV